MRRSAREGDAFLFDVKLDAKTRELLVGAEMSRRAFTNACNIMRRHDFARHWERWRAQQRAGSGGRQREAKVRQKATVKTTAVPSTHTSVKFGKPQIPVELLGKGRRPIGGR